MKKLFIISSFLIVTQAFASGDNNEHFDPELEKTCQQQAVQKNCGIPKDDRDANFMTCVESKMSSFSKDCQVVHQRMVLRFKELSRQ